MALKPSTLMKSKQSRLVDQETPGSPSKESPGKHATTRGKRVLGISAAIVVAIAGSYFAWNAFHYEDTDDAQVDGHVMELSTRINGQIQGRIRRRGAARSCRRRARDPRSPGLQDRGGAGPSESGRCGSHSREFPLEGADYFRNSSEQFGFGENCGAQRRGCG